MEISVLSIIRAQQSSLGDVYNPYAWSVAYPQLLNIVAQLSNATNCRQQVFELIPYAYELLGALKHGQILHPDSDHVTALSQITNGLSNSFAHVYGLCQR